MLAYRELDDVLHLTDAAADRLADARTGKIWGTGENQNFTLTIGAPGAAIPEPASLSLLGVMLAGLLLARPRRQPRGNETRE